MDTTVSGSISVGFGGSSGTSSSSCTAQPSALTQKTSCQISVVFVTTVAARTLALVSKEVLSVHQQCFLSFPVASLDAPSVASVKPVCAVVSLCMMLAESGC